MIQCLPSPAASTCPIYAFSGGLRLGNSWTALSGVWNGAIYGIDLVSQVLQSSFTSMEQMSLVLSNVHDPNVQVSLAGWSLGARAATRFAGVLERMGSCVRGIFALDDRRKLPFSPAEAQQSIGLVGLLCAAETVPAFRASALC
ncbi:unnamed protein product [Durusdinium trenchii]|uniref:Uncharacterized protein n=1 Tax=Durusdinium trenchii TaxID=1381693 RepID=A0ABP0NC61_9DINO